MQLTRDIAHTSKAFLRRLGLDLGDPALQIFQNPTEEIQESHDRGKQPKLYSMSAAGGSTAASAQGVVGRLEENYLYSTRRFPLNIANNTIGSGAIAAQDYLYFTTGIGDIGTANGYFSLANLTLQQTNMANGGKIPMGQGFRMFQLGISFNAQAINADIAQLMDTMNMRFEKQNQSLVLQHGPIKLWPGGTGTYGFASTTAVTTTLQAASNGMPAITNCRSFRNPRVLSANEQFQYVLNAAANTSNSNTAVALSAFVEVTIWLFGQVLNTIPS